MPAELVARLQVLAAALLFSTGGAAIKASSLSSWQVAGFRSAIAFFAVLVILPRSRARWTARSLSVGFCYAATMVLFVVANKLTTAANTIFLQYTSPLYLVLAGPLLLDEPVRPRDLVYLCVLGASLSLFFVDAPARSQSAPQPMLGNALALLSGAFWAATALGLRWMARPEAAARRWRRPSLAGTSSPSSPAFPPRCRFGPRSATSRSYSISASSRSLSRTIFSRVVCDR